MQSSENPFVLPSIRTRRLQIRALVPDDLPECQTIFSESGWLSAPSSTPEEQQAQRASWLDWTVASYREFAKLYQLPLGSRAVVETSSQRFIGLVGFVPSFEPFERLPSFGQKGGARRTLELGLACR